MSPLDDLIHALDPAGSNTELAELRESWGRRYGKHLKRRHKPGHIRLYHVDHVGHEHHAASFHHPDELAHWLKENRGNGRHGITIRVHGPGNALGGRALRAFEERDLVRRLDAISEHREAFRYGEHTGWRAGGAMATDAVIGLGAIHFGPNWLPSDHQDHVRQAIEYHSGYVYQRARGAGAEGFAAHLPHPHIARPRDPILEALRGPRRHRGGGEGEEVYDEEHDVVRHQDHARVPGGSPGGGRFAKGSPREVADKARQKAIADGHPAHIADAIHRGVLERLSPAVVRDRDSGEEYIRRRIEPNPHRHAHDPDDAPQVTLMPMSGESEAFHVYHGGRHVGRVAFVPNLPTIPTKGGAARGSFDVPGSWRAQVPGYGEASTRAFNKVEPAQYGYRDGKRVRVDDEDPVPQHSRWRTVGFGDTQEDAVHHVLQHSPGADEELSDEDPPIQVTPKHQLSGDHDYDGEYGRMFLNDVLEDLKGGSGFNEIVDAEMEGGGKQRRRDVENEVAAAMRHLQKVGRWRPPGQDGRDNAVKQANLAFDRARKAGHPRHKANAIRKAVYAKLAPENPQSIPPALTPQYRDIDPTTGLRESELEEARRRGDGQVDYEHSRANASHCLTPVNDREFIVTHPVHGHEIGRIRRTGTSTWEAVTKPNARSPRAVFLGHHHQSRDRAMNAVVRHWNSNI